MANENHGPNLTVPAILLVILAALGVSPTLLNTPPPTAPAPPTNALARPAVPAVAEGESPDHSAAKLLEDFFDTDSEQVNSDKPWSHNDAPSIGADSDWAPSDPRRDYQLNFLIASVPEPGSAPLRYEFDAQLDAIGSAAAHAGYTLDSFDIPWLDEAKQNSQEFRLAEGIDFAIPSRGADSTILTLKPKGEKRRSGHEPGLMLFRSDDAKDKSLLVLFLVGENPTRGVNKTALRDALDQISWLAGWKRTHQPAPFYLLSAAHEFAARREVKIIGPTFSGSAASLRNSLYEWLESFRRFPSEFFPSVPVAHVSIVSGSANAVGNSLDLPPGYPEIFWYDLTLLDGSVEALQAIPTSFDFSTLRVSEQKITQRTVQYFLGQLCEKPCDRRDLAILSENTTYGSSSLEIDRNQGILRMEFPLRISDLRTAFSRPEQARTPASLDLSRRDLPLPDESSQDQNDVVRPFSARTAVYNELVLAKLLTTIREEHIRYVGIVATDVEDLVFLVQRIREYCPDTIVFTNSSDLRFTHSELSQDLEGMLVFSTYPLFQTWVYPFDWFRQSRFRNEDAEGVFNATLVQLNAARMMVDYGDPLVRDGRSPVLWLSVVGHQSIWPVTFEPASSLIVPGARYPIPPRFELSDFYPRSIHIAFWLLTIFSVVAALALLRNGVDCQLLARLVPDSSRLARLSGDTAFSDLIYEKRIYLAAFSFALISAYAFGTGFYFLPWKAVYFSREPRYVPISLSCTSIPAALASAAAMVLLVVAAIKTGSAIARSPVKRSAASRGAWFSIVFTVLVLALSLGFAGWMWALGWRRSLLFFVRGAYIWNGVSPLHPLLFAAIAALCLGTCDLRRFNLLDECRVVSPFLGFDPSAKSFEGVDAVERNTVRLLECGGSELPLAVPMLVLLVIAFLSFDFLKVWPAYSIDGAAFDWFFLVLWFGLYVLFSLHLLRFASVWWQLRHLLRRLYFHPSRTSYELLRTGSLPGRPSDQRIRVFEGRPSLTCVEFCLERAREILRIADQAAAAGRYTLASPFSNALKHDIGWAEFCLSNQLEAAALADWRVPLRRRIFLQDAMARLSACIAAILEPVWRLQPHPPQIGEADQNQLAEGNLFVASRVVDFLRQVFPQIWSLVSFATAGLLALVLAVSQYPFPARDTMLWWSWIILLSAVGVTIFVFVQMNSDRILSMLAGTAPGRLSWDSTFTLQLLLFAVIPILTLLGAHFPRALGGFFSWIGGLFGGARRTP